VTKAKCPTVAPAVPCAIEVVPDGFAVRLARPIARAPHHPDGTWYRRTGTIAGAALVRQIIGEPGGTWHEGGALWIVEAHATVIAVCHPGSPA